jgi:hypothetical protein
MLPVGNAQTETFQAKLAEVFNGLALAQTDAFHIGEPKGVISTATAKHPQIQVRINLLHKCRLQYKH